MVTLTDGQYASLLRDSIELQALTEEGVDNWDWYGVSLQNNFDSKYTYEDLLDLSDEELIEYWND